MEITKQFRVEFFNAITCKNPALNSPSSYTRRNGLRARLSKFRFIRFCYQTSRNSFRYFNSSIANVRLSSSSHENISGTVVAGNDSRMKVFVVLPYFLEMNGPTSHYGTLIEICKSLNLNVHYVASEKSYKKDPGNSAFDDFIQVTILGPQDLNYLFAEKSLVINCGSPWVYRNLDGLTEKGTLVIDYLFNHVGHTWSNLTHRDKIFHTVCQHSKLLRIMQETTPDSINYSCIPIPLPRFSTLKESNLQGSDLPLWVGRLSPEKGIDRLLEIASNYFQQTGKPIRVIGAGPNAKDLKPGILNGSIDYLGELPNSKTLEVIQETAIVINTSYIEGVSVVALESLALGATVISFDVGGMSDLLWHPRMKICDGTMVDFVELITKSELMENSVEISIPTEFTQESHEVSWKKIISTTQKILSERPY